MAMRIEKEKKKVDLYTSCCKIRGDIHIHLNARLTDTLQALSKQSGFLPITDAVVKFKDSTVREEKFLLIKISEIEMICLKDKE